MTVLTAEEMRETDRSASEDCGIPSSILMEHAAIAVCRIIRQEYPDAVKIAVICGKGNNGGDGIAAARILKGCSLEPVICLALGEDRMSELAAMNLDIIRKTASVPVLHLKKSIEDADLIVDALFGTGFKGTVSGAAAEIIDSINASGKPVVSIDIPSGLNADTGRVSGTCIRADVTVAAAYAKRCFFLYPGSELSGRLFIADIGIPDCADSECSIPDPMLLAEWMPHRKKNDWKGSSGRLFILAGSDQYTGAPAFCCRAAMKAGCGMVYLAVPDSIEPIMRSKLNEEIIIPYNANHLENIFEQANKCDAAVIGSGMGNLPFFRKVISLFLKEAKIPAVIDADALYPELILPNAQIGKYILTPHAGEMARLLDKTVEEICFDPIEAAKEAASIFRSAVIMKGPNSITALPEGYFYFNPTGCEALATAGSGDVLSGIIGAMASKGCSPEEAAVLGCFIHGAAGDYASEEIGINGVTASDIINFIPKASNVLFSKDSSKIEKMMKIGKVSIL